MNWPEKQTQNIPPPDTILHIGAGRCSELDTWRETGAKRIVLVEPNPELLPELRRRTQGLDQVEIVPYAVDEQAGRESLRLFNFPMLSSLREPTGLRSMLPGLQQTGRAMVETKRLATLADELQLDPDGRHRLIIDAPGMEAEIVDQLIADDLASIFTAVDVIAGREPWYQGSQPLQALIERLEAAGYEPGTVDTGNDPEWPRAIFRYSRHAAENNRLAEELERLQERLRSQNEEFSRRFAELSQERDEANAKLESEQKNARAAAEENGKLQKQNKELTGELKKLKDAAQEAQNQIEETRTERDKLKARVAEQASQIKDKDAACNDADSALEKAKNELEQLKQQLDREKDQHNQVADLQRKMETLFDQQQEFIRGTTNALGQHVTRSTVNNVRQVEALIGVQRYLDSGEVPLRLAGTGMDPDMAGYLVQRLQARNYDLVIEFGAGPSTLLLARALVAQIVGTSEGNKNQKALRGPTESGEGQQHMRPSGDELPRRMISFEHDRVKFRSFQQELQQEGLDDVVEMVHAPLLELEQEEERILFYDCKRNLEEIARIYDGRVVRILVVVDGPTTQSSDSGRTQALPVLLQYLARHQLDIVLNDQNRSGEEQLAERWRELLEKRDVAFQQHNLEVQRSGLLISINE